MYVHKKQKKRSQRVQEDLAERQLVRYQSGLPGRCASFLTERQRTMRADEVVVTLQERHVIVQVLGKARMARAPTAEVRAALTNRQVQALYEARIDRGGILGIEECFVQLGLGTSDQPRLHPEDPIAAEVLYYLRVDAEEAEDLGDYPFVQLQTVGGEQEALRESSSLQALLQGPADIACSAATNHDREPQAGPDLDHGVNPDLHALVKQEASDLVGLQLV